MAEYKNVYYADSSLPMSAGDISYAEAVSVGDRLQEIKLDSAIAVADSAARDALFPTPSQGDAVWRNDLAIEQRWYGAYNAQTNPGGRTTAGWYATTSNIRPIIPTLVATAGTGASGSINQLGEVSFTKATQVRVDNCLPYSLTGNFNSFKVVVNIDSTVTPFSYPLWGFTKAGVFIAGTAYSATYQGVSASANTGNTWSNTNYAPLSMPVAIYNCYAELNLEPEMQLLGGSNVSIGYHTQSQAYTTAGNNSLHMLSGNVTTTTSNLPDGFYLVGASGTMPMTGTVKFYGIR
jgi:hypothetical protein